MRPVVSAGRKASPIKVKLTEAGRPIWLGLTTPIAPGVSAASN
jgi:hypothetical protein